MKIKNIKINSYGNLINKNINLDKLNIIYGKNESGKSTLLNFIQNILYGISKNKNGKTISDYDKYYPWNKNDIFSGKIEYELDNKNTYEIYRDFNKKNPEIYNELKEEISNKFKIDKKLGNQFFVEQTNIDENTFVQTILTKQREVYIDEANQGTLLQKVANLSESGMEDVSYKKAISKLNTMLLNEVGTNNSKGRPINITLETINKYNEELKNINDLKENRFQIEEEYNNVKKELDEENIKNKLINKIKELLEKNKLEKEKIKIKNNYLEENNEKINKLNILKNNFPQQLNNNNSLEDSNEEKNENKIIDQDIKTHKNKSKKINRKKVLNISFIILLIILNIFNFIYINNRIINLIIFALIPIYLIYYIIKIKNNKKNEELNKIKLDEINKKNNELKNQIEILNGQISLLEKNNNELTNEINDINNQILNYEIINKQKILDEFSNYFSKEYISDLFNNNLELLLHNSNSKINELNIKLHKLELDRENVEPELDRLINIEEDLSIKKEELEKLETKAKEFNIVKETLEDAYNEMKSNISPQFINNFSKDFDRLTNGKYTNIIINDKIMVELDDGRYVPAETLSIGTIEQIYLSLRLSVINELSKEKLPIMLDEAFAYYDDERLKAALDFFNKIENQVILFTCTNREKQLLEKMNVQFNFIEL